MQNRQPRMNSSYPPPARPRRKVRRRRSFGSVILTIVVCAALCAGVLFGAVYLAGVRYITVQIADNTYVKFLGTVTDEGYPYKGRIIYSDGISAEVSWKKTGSNIPTGIFTKAA